MNEPKRVLIVEDEPHVREFMHMALEQDGYAVRSGDPADLPTLLADWTPDVVVTDLMLGSDVDGTEIAAQMRVRFPGVRVVLYSATPHAEVFKGLQRELGADAYLAKPFSLEDLSRAVEGA